MNQLSSDEEYVGPSPQVYSKIEFKTKLRLVSMIYQGSKIRSSAKLLKIKESTAKMIWKKYKDTGKIGKKKVDLKELTQQEPKHQTNKDNGERQHYEEDQNIPQIPIYILPFFPSSFPFHNIKQQNSSEN